MTDLEKIKQEKYECEFCEKSFPSSVLLRLNVVSLYDGDEVNEPEFTICRECWRDELKYIEKKLSALEHSDKTKEKG